MQQVCVNTTAADHIGPFANFANTHFATNTGTGIHAGSNSNGNQLQKWSVTSQDISWNGKTKNFPDLKECVEGYFIQLKWGIMSTPISSHLTFRRGAVLNEFPEFGLNEEQLHSNNHVMCGELKAKQHIRVHNKSQDLMHV